MPQLKKQFPTEKIKLHPRNKHRDRYDFKSLIQSCPALAPFVSLNKYRDESIDFANPAAVKMLNKALLKHFYGIEFWDIPPNYLCPPIPGRADYIHHIADVLALTNDGKIPTGKHVRCLDIGVGANCVYPIIGHQEYGWTFVGSDIDAVSIASANKIIAGNPSLQSVVECRLQKNLNSIFHGIIQPDEVFTLTICNPPFHSSAADAQAASQRKVSNLSGKKISKPTLNFGGQNRELWYAGGEEKFVGNMIRESQEFKSSCQWFSSVISKQSSLKSIYAALKHAGAIEVKTIPMGQGNKISRIVAWTFWDDEMRKKFAR